MVRLVHELQLRFKNYTYIVCHDSSGSLLSWYEASASIKAASEGFESLKYNLRGDNTNSRLELSNKESKEKVMRCNNHFNLYGWRRAMCALLSSPVLYMFPHHLHSNLLSIAHPRQDNGVRRGDDSLLRSVGVLCAVGAVATRLKLELVTLSEFCWWSRSLPSWLFLRWWYSLLVTR